MLIIAKLLIFLLCALIHLYNSTVSMGAVSVALISFIICCMPAIIKTDFLGHKGLKILTEIICSTYMVVALFIPELRYYIPLLFIDICGLRLIVSFILGFLGMMFPLIKGDLWIGLIIILLSMLSVLIQLVISKTEVLADELKAVRDTSKEREILIEEKNRTLRENQDAQVYMATLKERNRIAREIHDNVGHMLTRSILQVGAIKTINTNEILSEPLDGLHDTLNTAMASIRSSVHDLHDESIDLLSAIKEITDSVDKFSVNIEYDMGYDIPRSIKYCFISIIKEAVNNAIKHSNCTDMDILVQEHPAFYQLLIQDNGTDIKKSSAEGIGLTNMKDRVNSLNGNIKINTDHGFKILISIIKSNLAERR